MSEIRKYIESHKEEMIEFLGELIAVKSVQGEAEDGYPFGREPARALEIMLKKCEESGFTVENTDNYVGSVSFGGENAKLGILTHLDVVPEGQGWTSNPYKLERSEGKLIGRGAIDDKGPAVSVLYALKAIRDLGIPLKEGVQLIFGTNEENGSDDLTYYKTKKKLPPCVFTPDGEYPVINGEKGMLRVYFSADCESITINGGDVINAVPKKCSFSVVIPKKDGPSCVFGSTEGRAAHASTPEKGENAITKAFEEIFEYVKEQKDEELHCPEFIEDLSELFPHNEFDGKSCGLGFSDEISGSMTCVLTMLNSDENGVIHGGIDIRFPLDRKKKEISEIICGKLEKIGCKIESCEGVEPHITDENSEFVQSLLKVYTKVTGDEGCCISIGGGTYVHEIEGGVAFGAEFPGEENNMHGADEFITEENLLKNAEIIAEAIIEICG